ncbi:MAG: hypothetical protein PQJ61_06220 [Spirochaetales bacterium]|uniref:Uncharacterized protein n=1 Tax=Candidatus Thalassospirochaeta sargassi TaxID=3119039 RepID=A0AAJ1MM50_9SPIO|nr:hypothetical protein [Spirochaetales bacterium]
MKNKALAEFLDQPDFFMGMGEEDETPYEKVFIDNISAHYLYYENSDMHRFSTAEQHGEYIIGRRVISSYTTYGNDNPSIPIEQLAVDTLYLSFMYGEWDEDYNRIELQKDAVKIRFK